MTKQATLQECIMMQRKHEADRKKAKEKPKPQRQPKTKPVAEDSQPEG